MGRPCPVCGAKDGTCGDTPLAFAPIDDPWRFDPVADSKVYLPKQHVRRGKTGYKVAENVVVVDETGKEDKSAKKSIHKT